MNVRRSSKPRRDYELRCIRQDNADMKHKFVGMAVKIHALETQLNAKAVPSTDDNIMAVLMLWLHDKGLVHEAAAGLCVKTEVLAKLLPKRMQEGYANADL